MKKQNELTSYIKKEFINHNKKNKYYILIDNLNSYINKTLNYSDALCEKTKISQSELTIYG
ncbi:hypothetical protein RIR_e4685_A0A2N0Q6K1_9GLOM [Rhizophagus irregularis DAOM 181602=DAOM 197198]|nr:hypothetical protein RIR_e4685_A0A2N0Q6K1_9GLOM [Rhizophagus irregularis DAOM 181602=DAOM 197198]